MTQFVASQMIDPMAPFGPGSITGLLPTAISGTNTTAAVTVSAGAAVDSTNQRLLTLAAPYNWSVATDYQGGTTLPNSSTIHFFLCVGNSGARIWAHTGLVPTPPAGYNSLYRRAFSLTTGAGGALLPGISIENEGGSLLFYLTAVVQDANLNLSAASILLALSVPSGGLRLAPMIRGHTATGSIAILFSSPDEADVAAGSASVSPGYDLGTTAGSATGTWTGPVSTDASGRVRARATGTASCYIYTRGWKDWRR